MRVFIELMVKLSARITLTPLVVFMVRGLFIATPFEVIVWVPEVAVMLMVLFPTAVVIPVPKVKLPLVMFVTEKPATPVYPVKSIDEQLNVPAEAKLVISLPDDILIAPSN